MLTALSTGMQLQLMQLGLISVDMSSLKDRLKTAHARDEKVTPAQIARACGISAAAVSKWFSGASTNIKAEHLFIVARLYRVDAEWLALGKGKPERKATSSSIDIPPARLALIRLYGKLPKDLRFQIRGLITVLAAASSDRYAQWSDEEGERAAYRDAQEPEEV